MITRDIRQFMSRDWRRARDAKDEYWAGRIRQLGAEEAFRVAEELRLQNICQNPNWPSNEDRQEDLAAHMRLAELLQRVPYTGGR
jgi:hypothetical protein